MYQEWSTVWVFSYCWPPMFKLFVTENPCWIFQARRARDQAERSGEVAWWIRPILEGENWEKWDNWYPLGNWHILPWEKKNHLQNELFRGYVSFREGISLKVKVTKYKWYCWWKKSCTTWDVWDKLPIKWCRISAINRISWKKSVFFGCCLCLVCCFYCWKKLNLYMSLEWVPIGSHWVVGVFGGSPNNKW